MAVEAILLGSAQDGGVPQAGCGCARCAAAWADPSLRRRVSCLGLFDTEAGASFLIDATPDFREQLHDLLRAAPGTRLSGLLLTHAHMGHYTGLVHLGFEAMATRGLPVYGTRRMLAFLRAHAPWRQLVDQGNIALRAVTPGEWLALTPDLSARPAAVPHRDEWSDTVGYTVRGPARQLLYVPDIESWAAWARPPWSVDARAAVAAADVALLDGTFYDADELPGRDLAAIGHPLVRESEAVFAGVGTEVVYVHLNHTNRLVDEPERRQRWGL
jgi:pyrroloquinoline quinone biosynthesis protein B